MEMMPSRLRSAATRPSPACTALPGVLIRYGLPSIVTLSRLRPGHAPPNSARPIISTPEPTSPCTPVIVPRRTVKSTPRSHPSTASGPSTVTTSLAEAALGREGGIEVADPVADDGLQHLIDIGRVGREIAGIAAVAQHHDAAGDGEHLLEIMRDVDDRNALAPAAAG